MSPIADPLDGLYEDTEKTVEQDDPLNDLYEDQQDTYRYQDPVSENLRAQGYEPDFSEELERASARGQLETFKGIAKGATLGLSEYLPGFKAEDEKASAVGEAIGSFAPIGALMKVFNNPLTKLAAKSPVLTNQLKSLGNLIGAFGAGGAYGATTEAIKKREMPSTDDFVEHGATWALLDGALQAGGALYRFTKSLASKAKRVKKPEWKVVNETVDQMKKEGVDFTNQERVQAKALSILEDGAAQNPKQAIVEQAENLANRKIDKKVFDRLESEVPPEPYFPRQFDSLEVIENTVNTELDNALENMAPRASSDKQLGENIKAAVDRSRNLSQDTYKPAYELAEEAASRKFVIPRTTEKVATDILKSLEDLKTQPEGYKNVINTLISSLEDAGFLINRDGKGAIELVVSQKNVSGSQLMELGRRLNSIIRYDSIDKSVQDRLKPVVQAIKQDIRSLLKESPEALELYENAEKDFISASSKFGKESIRKIRKTEAGEKVAKLVRNPTTVADLKQVMSESEFKEVEREILQNIRDQANEQRARNFYREMRPMLSADSQQLAEELLDAKIPKSNPSRKQSLREKTQGVVLNDFAKASLTGERPEASLKLWKTLEGQQLIKQALEGNKSKKEILDYLSNQSLKDMTSSIVSSDGKIDFKKLRDFLKDPAAMENIRIMAGDEGVNFIKNLETIADRAQKNLSVIEGRIDKGSAKERKEISKELSQRGKERLDKFEKSEKEKSKSSLLYRLDEFFENLGIKTKTALGLLGFAKFGIPGAVEALAAFKALKFMLTNKSFQKHIKQAAGPRTDPKYILSAYEAMDKNS